MAYWAKSNNFSQLLNYWIVEFDQKLLQLFLSA